MLLFLACAPDRDPPALALLETVPAAGAASPANAPIRLRFNGWLDPEGVAAGAIDLHSGDLSFGFTAGYDPVDRALVIIPPVDLRVGLAYRLEVMPEAVRGLDGRRLAEPITLDFVAGPPTNPRPPADPVPFARLQGLFARACDRCHGAEPLAWPPLTEQALLMGESLRDPGRRLVAPGRPLESQLVLKLLPGYPGVHGAPMPLEGPPLTADQVRTIIGWVEGL
ncbi:MAG: Ig-like domain-containing protein [Myxococcales bacterium]|nr:Ig-like domain-containing protein [Myxococcales bacterium]MCB9522707.1 Ig-like domain-containing protein [Myxococcales bacterium]